jgi:hypothetical protein
MELADAAMDLSSQTNDESSFLVLHNFPTSDLERKWRDCLARIEFPAHYNSPEFFLEPSWKGKLPFAILALHQGAVVGVLTGLNEEYQVTSGLQSRPQICVDTPDPMAAMSSLTRGLLAEAGSAKLITVYSWSRVPMHAFESYGFRRRPFVGNVVLDLTKGPETLFKQMDKKRRSGIRSAIHNGIEIFQAVSPQDAAAFYRVYLTWRETERKTIEAELIPWTVFEQRFRQREGFRFFLARYSGKVIAGITLRFAPGGLVEYANNSSLDECLHLRPNDLLVWRAIEWACGQRFRRFSLGGAHRFLREFGGEVEPICRYRLDRTLLRQHDLREATLDVARASFRKLPYRIQGALRRVLGNGNLRGVQRKANRQGRAQTA